MTLISQAITLGALLAWQTAGAGGIEALGAAPDPDFPDFADRTAFISTASDGSQQLTARLVSKQAFFDFQPGDRLGGDVSVDGAAIWGTGGVAVDVMFSGVVKPGSILVLLDDLRVVEIQGIWGTGGVAIGDVVVHGPMWDVAACGTATTFAETLRAIPEEAFDDPILAFDDPILAIGTEGGCVGFAGYMDPTTPFEELPIQSTGDPLIAIDSSGIGEHPVDDLASTKVDGDWGLIPAGFAPDTGNWFGCDTGFPDVCFADALWSTNPNDWLPTEGEWLELTALAGGQAFGIFPGTRGFADHPGAPPYVTFAIDASQLDAPLTSLTTPGFGPDAEPKITIGTGVLAETNLVGANGTAEVKVTSLNPQSIEWGTTTAVDLIATAPTIFPVSKLTLASLWAISADGQRILFDPVGDLANQVTLGGVLSVDLGPHAYQRSAQGRFLSAQIEAGGDDALNIVAPSLELAVAGDPNGPLMPIHTNTADKDADGNLELVAKFDRQAFHDRIGAFPDGAEVTLELTWNYVDECDTDTPCTGSYTQVVTIVP